MQRMGCNKGLIAPVEVEIQTEPDDSAISIKFSGCVILKGTFKESSQVDYGGLIFLVILGVAFSPNLPYRVAWVLEDLLSFLRLCVVGAALK